MYTREHNLAEAHPIALRANKKADAAVARLRKQYRAKAEALRAKAEALLAEASELSYLANRHHEYDTPFASLRKEIEDAGYWAAREAIGTLPRDAAGGYVDPAPQWAVSYDGERVGIFSGEERAEVLATVCPRGNPEGRRWSDYEVELVK